ncbi:hypothetical protein [Fodinicurvata sediminis]|uniref:hypothetical protein n=1 Tax=Fodinicurvata sediminis TaxID=1121832 RepID=UPI0004255A4C|nr:hypothetical protein [Fodinicurvata sediminis]
MQRIFKPGLAGALVLAATMVLGPVAHAANCTTGARAAADIWKEYDKIAKSAGCAVGTAGAAILSAGATLPQSAQIYKQCFEQADKIDQTSRKMIAQWNKLNKNGWGTIGPRELRVGGSYEGNIKSQFTRMFISSSPIAEPFVKLRIKKRDERANKGKTRVTVCSYPPGGPGHGVEGKKIWSFTIAPGRQNQGKVWQRAFAIPGNVLTVAFKGQSAVKAMKYRLEADRIGADHTVLIASSDVSGSTGYDLSVSDYLEPVAGTIAGYYASVDSNDSRSRRRARGTVGSGNDAYRVVGRVNDVQLDDPNAANVLIDGKPRGSGGQQDNSVGRVSGVPKKSEAQQPTGMAGGSSPNTDSDHFAGTWDSSYGELQLHRIGRYLVGDYASQGIIAGKVTDGCVAGVFTNGGRNGVFRWKTSGNGQFNGRWGWSGQGLSDSWSGQRTGPAPDRLNNFARGQGTTQTMQQDRTVYDGQYNSNYGPITLLSRDLFMVGDYADKGIMAGMWDGNGFVGRFTNGSRTGWFDLEFFSKTGDFRKGQWGWVDNDNSGSWTLSQTASGTLPDFGSLPSSVSCR